MLDFGLVPEPAIFKTSAELIATHLEAADHLVASEATLMSERETSELREPFIAVLGHDLRNPLASIEAGTKTLSSRAAVSAAALLSTARPHRSSPF